METNKTTTPLTQDSEVEVIVSDAVPYKPQMAALEKKAIKQENLAPVVLNMESQGASEAEIVEKVLDITITSELKKEMAMPCVKMDAAGFTKSNAAAIAMKMVSMAVDGNLGAIKEVLNRTEGRVPNRNESASLKMTGNLSDLMAKIDNNKK